MAGPRRDALGWADARILRHGDLALDPRTRQVRRGDRAIALTWLEFEVLELFLRQRDRAERGALDHLRSGNLEAAVGF